MMQNESATGVQVGALLAQARAAKGLSLGDVARQLKLKVRQVEALERDDHASFPSAVFLRGFLRNYAKFVQVDIGAQLAQMQATQEAAAAAAAAPARMRASAAAKPVLPQPPAVGKPRRSPVWMIGGAVGVIALAGGLVAAYQLGRPSQWGASDLDAVASDAAARAAVDRSAPAAQRPAAPALAVQDAAGLQQDSTGVQQDSAGVLRDAAVAQQDSTGAQQGSTGPQQGSTGAQQAGAAALPPAAVQAPPVGQAQAVAAVQPVAQSEAVQVSGAAVVTPVAAQPGQPPAAPTTVAALPGRPPAGARTVPGQPVQPPAVAATVEAPPVTVAAAPAPEVKLQFDAEAWVEVRAASGKVVFSQINAAGSERVIRGDGPLRLVVGNAPNVRVYYQGAPVDLTPHTRYDVARLTLR